MVMRYYGGGIGHLSNTPLRKADPLTANASAQVAVVPEGEQENTARDEATDGRTHDVIMHDEELEADEQGDDDEGDSTDPEDYDYSKDSDEDEDEHEGSTCSSDEDEEDGSGYDSP